MICPAGVGEVRLGDVRVQEVHQVDEIGCGAEHRVAVVTFAEVLGPEQLVHPFNFAQLIGERCGVAGGQVGETVLEHVARTGVVLGNRGGCAVCPRVGQAGLAFVQARGADEFLLGLADDGQCRVVPGLLESQLVLGRVSQGGKALVGAEVVVEFLLGLGRDAGPVETGRPRRRPGRRSAGPDAGSALAGWLGEGHRRGPARAWAG